MSALLAAAARDRLLMLLLEPPSKSRPAELLALMPSLPDDVADTVAHLAATPTDDVEADYHRVLGPTGAVPFCESDLSGNAFAKGNLITDVSGFYKAFRYPENVELKDSPDHIANELGYVSYLAIKEAYAEFMGLGESAVVSREAREAFGRDHLDAFAKKLAGKLIEAALPSSYYATVAALLATRG